jgi:hypothetical protein
MRIGKGKEVKKKVLSVIATMLLLACSNLNSTRFLPLISGDGLTWSIKKEMIGAVSESKIVISSKVHGSTLAELGGRFFSIEGQDASMLDCPQWVLIGYNEYPVSESGIRGKEVNYLVMVDGRTGTIKELAKASAFVCAVDPTGSYLCIDDFGCSITSENKNGAFARYDYPTVSLYAIETMKLLDRFAYDEFNGKGYSTIGIRYLEGRFAIDIGIDKHSLSERRFIDIPTE